MKNAAASCGVLLRKKPIYGGSAQTPVCQNAAGAPLFILHIISKFLLFSTAFLPLTVSIRPVILIMRPGRSGAAQPFKLRQVREEAAARRILWVTLGHRPGRLLSMILDRTDYWLLNPIIRKTQRRIILISLYKTSSTFCRSLTAKRHTADDSQIASTFNLSGK